MNRELPIRVAGDGHGNREFRCRPFGHQGLAPGFRRPKAEQLMPERLTPVAVTWHLEWVSEYRVWSIEYRERHRFGWRVAATGGRWRVVGRGVRPARHGQREG